MSEDCLFCSFVSRAVMPDIVGESEHSLAFRDINAQAPTHVLIVPKRHVVDAVDLAAASAEEFADLFRLAATAAQGEDLGSGYRLVFNTGPHAGQVVRHVHLHLLGGRPFGWPPG